MGRGRPSSQSSLDPPSSQDYPYKIGRLVGSGYTVLKNGTSTESTFNHERSGTVTVLPPKHLDVSSALLIPGFLLRYNSD